MMFLYDYQYLNTIKNIEYTGIDSQDRTSVGQNRKIFAVSRQWEIGDDLDMPFIQCRAFAPRIAFEELMWMLRGHTHAKVLQDKNIHIWDKNTSREFLDSVGMESFDEGNAGKTYGWQMRNFNGVDQLQMVFDSLKNNPDGRRHLVSLWNPADLDCMALPPCHLLYQFLPENNKLNLSFYMRSNDWFYGHPYNMAFASFWLVLFSKALGYTPGKVYYFGADVHMYQNQREVAMQTAERWKGMDHSGTEQPSISINRNLDSLEDVLSLEWNEISINGFSPLGNIGQAPEMAT